MRPVILAALVVASSLSAELRPQPGTGDPRIQSVLYDPQQVVQLQVATGYQVTVEFGPDERIENVAVGDSGAWQVTRNKRGDLLFIKGAQGDVSTNLTVVTDARTYAFALSPASGASPDMTFTVRFRYPTAAPATIVNPAAHDAGHYKLRGDRALRPVSVEDDGEYTRITWADKQTMPAVFAIDPNGVERVVDGMVRDGAYVIDSVSNKLIFRVDKRTASAVRVPQRKVP